MARTEGFWNNVGNHIKTIFPSGVDILVNGLNKYINFNAVSGVAGYGFRDNNGVMEYRDAAGAWTPFSSGVSPNPTWEFYATNWSTEPIFNIAITGGMVFDYTLDGVTRYRFVADPYDPETDAFYETFSLGVLSDLIVTRG